MPKSPLIYIDSYEPKTYNELEEALDTIIDVFKEQQLDKTRLILVLEIRKRGK